MESVITLTLPVPPSLNRMYRMVNNRWLISAAGRAYKQEVAGICLVNRVKPFEGPVSVNIDIYRPQKRGDLDNYFKSLFDALIGNLWMDDSQIVEIRAGRHDDKENPRVLIEVRELVGL